MMTVQSDMKSDWLRLINRLNESRLYDCFSEDFITNNIDNYTFEHPQLNPAWLNGCSWVTAILNEPSLAAECNWDKLSGDDWTRLICSRPEFISKCNFDKLSMMHWLGLLIFHPPFGSLCPWDKFAANDDYIIDLLEHCPMFADRLVCNRLTESDLVELYCHHEWLNLTTKDKCRLRSLPSGFGPFAFYPSTGVIYVTK